MRRMALPASGAVPVGALADPLEVAARPDPVAAVHGGVEAGEHLHHLGGEVERRRPPPGWAGWRRPR